MTQPSPDKPRRGRRRNRPRPNRRADSHASAAAFAAQGHAAAIPEHPLIPAGEALLIDNAADLASLLDRLREARQFAYDTEFIGELSYHPRICLIQVATATEVALIDPLAGLELFEFWSLLADDRYTKIVHAGQQDLEPVVRHLQREPANVFDVQIAAGFVALPYPCSLSRLVEHVTGVKLGKTMTFTHWDQRPMSPVHRAYAADDVRYLPAIHAWLAEQLEARGHWHCAAEECAELCRIEEYQFDPVVQAGRVKKARGLSARNWAVLRELVAVRDKAAREHDVPPRTMLRDEILVALAKHPVKSLEQLAQLRGLPRPVEQAYGKAIVEATLAALERPSPQLPATKAPEETTDDRVRIDSLFAAISAYSFGRGIDPMLVGNRHDVAAGYRALVHGESQGEDARILRGWRGRLLRDLIREFLAGDASITLAWREGRLAAETMD